MAFIIADRVKETSTTTGTGALTLAGAMTGFSTFNSRCAVADTLYYAIQAVDAGGAPTGEWECGLGTYSAANTLTRTTVTSSSNADAAVNFAAGTKQVFISMPAVQARWARERLTADRTYYVRTDGSDSNSGLADTAGGAFLTIQKAVDAVCSIDCSVYAATIQIGDGTYTAQITLGAYIGSAPPTLQGNAVTPANVAISTTSADAIVTTSSAKSWVIKDLKLATATSGGGLYVTGMSVISFSNLVFGACAGSHMFATQGGVINITGNYAVSGGSSGGAHAYATAGGVIYSSGRTVTITGTPAFAAAWVWSDRGLGIFDMFSMTFSGSATGKRYALSINAICFVNGAATTYFPGSIAGTTATGGQYA